MTSRTSFVRAALIAGVVAVPATVPVAAFADSTPSPSASALPHHQQDAKKTNTTGTTRIDPAMPGMSGSMSSSATAEPSSTSRPTASSGSSSKTPSGGAATGSGSTQGSSHDGLLLFGVGLIAAAGVTYRFARRLPNRSEGKR